MPAFFVLTEFDHIAHRQGFVPVTRDTIAHRAIARFPAAYFMGRNCKLMSEKYFLKMQNLVWCVFSKHLQESAEFKGIPRNWFLNDYNIIE